MCAKQWAANSQALYDWNGLNIGNAAGRHRALIPNGKLCSANRPEYATLDEPSARWVPKQLTKHANGLYHFEYTATAPHRTAYFRYYLTKQGFNIATDRLGWDDLELVHDSGSMGASAKIHAEFALPARTGHHILYQVWQRSDSGEAFYPCSDVTLDGSSPTTPNPTPNPNPNPAPAPPAPARTHRPRT